MRTPGRTSASGRGRLPIGRRVVAGAVGGVLGALTGASFAVLAAAALSGAGIAPGETPAQGSLLDATHLPPLLTRTGEVVELRYDVHCASRVEGLSDAPCAAGGAVYIRPGDRGPYRELPLRVDPDLAEGRNVVRAPADIAGAAEGFTYYAILRSQTGETLTLPAGGPDSPHRSFLLGRAVDVRLGAHVFGEARQPDARVVVAAWGDGANDVGLEQGRGLPPIGPGSFDVDATRTIHLLDQVHRRVLRLRGPAEKPVSMPLPIEGTLADLSVDSNGTTYVLELASSDRAPFLRTFDRAGRQGATAEISERTASQVRIGPTGPLVHQQPSDQWMAAGIGGQQVSGDVGSGRPGRILAGGAEIVVLRRANEIRIALTDARGARTSWRVLSDTPLAEVQLAEPLGKRVVVVVRVYDDTRDEFLALVLGPAGLAHQISLASLDWAETAPLSRFRLAGSSLYRLGSTETGVFVDRFDLET